MLTDVTDTRTDNGLKVENGEGEGVLVPSRMTSRGL